MNSYATLVFSNHRPEMVPMAMALMARYDAIILEEPPDSGFRKMVCGQIGIDDYILTLDTEYPEFSRRMAQGLRGHYGSGKRLYQIEPFLEKLIQIHECFAAGGSPHDLKRGSASWQVYQAERRATAVLLDFYRISVRGTFDATVAAVKRFARADARRFELRDEMRAKLLVCRLTQGGTYYIEAGPIHYPLWRKLKHRLPQSYKLNVRFLMAEVARALGYHRHLYGPGDLLTLLYSFHPGYSSRRADLLAAQALVYNKLIAKEEIVAAAGHYPHTADELAADDLVRRLTLADCRRLFPRIRRASANTAADTVEAYLSRKRRQPSTR
jgi:hypothetical protein